MPSDMSSSSFSDMPSDMSSSSFSDMPSDMSSAIHFSLLSGFTVGKCTCFFPLLAKSGAASVAQMRRVSFEFCEKVILFVIVAKICNGKIKGLAIQYIFHCFFENSSEICIQYIFHYCLDLQ